MVGNWRPAIVLCVVVFITLCLTITVKDGYNKLKRDRMLPSRLITRLHQKSILDCVKECHLRRICNSFNYRRSTLTCELNFKTESDSYQLRNEIGFIYSQKSDWPKEMVGECAEHKCGEDQKCTLSPTKGTECVLSNCKDFIHASTNVTYESLDFGAKLEFTCRLDIQKKRRNTGTCRDDGVWTAQNLKSTCDQMTEVGSGHHIVRIRKRCFLIRCDMDYDGGGWTVIQHSELGTNFDWNKTWTEYHSGFGNVESNYWLGNRHIEYITRSEDHELYIKRSDGTIVQNDQFSMSKENENYKLKISPVGEFLNESNGMEFSAYDQGINKHCASQMGFGWWFYNCSSAVSDGLLTDMPAKMMIRKRM